MFRVLQFLLAIFVLGLFLSGGCINRRDRMDSNAAPSDAALPNPQRVSQWDEKDALTVPFEFNAASEGAPAVWLRLNGGKSRLFVVDTGCKPPLILWEETARALHLQRRSKEARRSEKDDSDFHLCSVSLRCVSARGNVKSSVHLEKIKGIILKSPFYFSDLYPVLPAGLIGNGLLQRLGRAVRFDFVAHRMTLYRHAHPPLFIPGATTVPLHKADGVYAVNAPLPDGSIQEMLVDTGCEGHLYIPQRLAARFKTREVANDGETFTDLTGKHGAIESLMPTLQVGDFIEKNVLTTQGQAGDSFCLLGVDYLSRFRVTLDYDHSELTLERAADYKRHSYKP